MNLKQKIAKFKKINKKLEDNFNKFIESGFLDHNEFQEYEICITKFDNKQK